MGSSSVLRWPELMLHILSTPHQKQTSHSDKCNVILWEWHLKARWWWTDNWMTCLSCALILASQKDKQEGLQRKILQLKQSLPTRCQLLLCFSTTGWKLLPFHKLPWLWKVRPFSLDLTEASHFPDKWTTGFLFYFNQLYTDLYIHFVLYPAYQFAKLN